MTWTGKSLDLGASSLDLGGKSLDLDEKSLDLDEKSLNLDEKSLNLDEGKSLNLDEGKSLNLDEKSLNLDTLPWTSARGWPRSSFDLEIVATASPQFLSAPVVSIWETSSPESHTPNDTLLRTSSCSHLDGLPLWIEKDHMALPSEAELQGMLAEVLS